MIWMQGEQTQPTPLIAVSYGSEALTDSQGVQAITVWPVARMDDFPFQAVILIHLLPTHRRKFPQCCQHAELLGFFEREKLSLKNGIVEIEPNDVG